MKYLIPKTSKMGLFEVYTEPISSSAPLLSNYFADNNISVIEWNSSHEFKEGDFCYVTSVNRIFRANADNKDRNPIEIKKDYSLNEYYVNLQAYTTSFGGWTDFGATNQYSWCDDKIGTQTIAEDELIIEFYAYNFRQITLFNVRCNIAKIEIYDPTTNVLEDTIIQNGLKFTSYDYYTFFTSPPEYAEDLNYYFDKYRFKSKIKVTLTGSEVRLGNVITGDPTQCGYTKWGTNNTILDFSKYLRDENSGALQVQKGNSIKKLTLPLYVKNLNEVPTIERAFRTELIGKIIYFIGDDNDLGLTNLNVLGIIRDSNVGIEEFNNYTAYITIEGII